ncbi:YGGT family protein [Forsythia ovata]|uniref:YGGT family protein n=1 Tax=Forsythia ovata TaxID=205694 RepID=A0ABD1W8J0_9LAMI
MKHPSDEDQKCTAKNSPSKFMILPLSPPFSFIHSAPFFRKQSISKPNFQFQLLTTETSNVVRQVHSSIVSSADKFLKLLHVFASQNAFVDKFLSFTWRRLQSCSQIPRRSYRNLDVSSHQNFAAILPGDSVAGIVVANGILNFLNIYNTLLIVRLVLTWFPNAPPAVVSPLSTLCDPYLNIFRGIIPPLGGTLDLSPILAFLVLNVFTSTASALPAELPSSGLHQDVSSHLTTSQEKWMTRLGWNKSKRSTGEN